MSHWIKAFSDVWPQLMRMSSTGAVPMLNNRLMITKCIHNGEANVWPGADRVTRPRRIRRLGRCLMSSTTPMSTSMRSVRGLFIHSARPRPSSSYICLSILSSVWPHIQLQRSSPRCGCWTPAIGKRGNRRYCRNFGGGGWKKRRVGHGPQN